MDSDKKRTPAASSKSQPRISDSSQPRGSGQSQPRGSGQEPPMGKAKPSVKRSAASKRQSKALNSITPPTAQAESKASSSANTSPQLLSAEPMEAQTSPSVDPITLNEHECLPRLSLQETKVSDNISNVLQKELRISEARSSVSSVSSRSSSSGNDEIDEEFRLAASRRGTWVHSHHNELPMVVTAALCLFQVLGIASYLVSIDYTRDPITHQPPYSFQSAVLTSCFAQTLVFTLIALRNDGRSKLTQVHWPTFYYSFLAGFFWAVYENLTHIAVMLCGAGTVAMILQSRIVFTAVARTLLLGAQLTELHWHGMAMQLVSMVGCQFYAMKDDTVSSTRNLKVKVRRMELGTGICLVASVAYAFATVLTEKLYKDPRFGHISYEAKFLYIMSRKLVFCGVVTVGTCMFVSKKPVFYGWTSETIIVPSALFLQVVTTHLVMYKLDALICCLGEIVSVAFVYFIEFILFGTGIRPVELCFMILVIQSVAIFVRTSAKIDHEEAKKKKKLLSSMSVHWRNFLDACEDKATEMKEKAEAMKMKWQVAKNVRASTHVYVPNSRESRNMPRQASDERNSKEEVTRSNSKEGSTRPADSYGLVAPVIKTNSHTEDSVFLGMNRMSNDSPPPYFSESSHSFALGCKPVT